jgi:hypothetical protein
MKNSRRYYALGLAFVCLTCFAPAVVKAQDAPTVLAGAELTRVTPPGFYFQGLSAPTQMRNAAVARFGSKRYVIVGLVDTSGYAADVRAKYEGFFITDSAITINGTALGTGAYGFGFSEDGKMQILDLAGDQVLSVATTKDAVLKRPRPLMMMKAADGVRLYRGKDYIVIKTN